MVCGIIVMMTISLFLSCRFRAAALPAALPDILGDFHLLPRVFHHRYPHGHSNHLQTLLRPEEE